MKNKVLRFIAKVLATIGCVLGVIVMCAILIVGCFGLAPVAICLVMAAIFDPDCTSINEYFKEKGLNITYTRKEKEND